MRDMGGITGVLFVGSGATFVHSCPMGFSVDASRFPAFKALWSKALTAAGDGGFLLRGSEYPYCIAWKDSSDFWRDGVF